jgi:hypothetical protein
VAAQDAIATVLPAPGGPVTTVSGACTPADSRRSSRSRRTIQGCVFGGDSFDFRTGSSSAGSGAAALVPGD